jgi:hypothetical protein
MVKRFAVLLLVGCAFGVLSASALAEAEAPGWEVTAHTFPTYLPPGAPGKIDIRAVNIGAARSQGVVTVTDKLPAGVVATEPGAFRTNEFWECKGNTPSGTLPGATVVTCTNNQVTLPHITGGGGVPTGNGPSGQPSNDEEFTDPLLMIAVEAPAGTTEGRRTGAEANHVTVSGGGAASDASVQESVTISSTPAPFGFAAADTWFSNSDGTIDMQAGSHPYEATFSFDFDNYLREPGYPVPSGGEPRDLVFKLPPGLIGNPTAEPRCPRAQFITATFCPVDTQVGIVLPTFIGDGSLGAHDVWNLVPPAGVPAEFGFNLDGNLILINAVVRSGSDYGITSITNNITRTEVVGAILTLWGDPSDPSHNPWRCAETSSQPFLCGLSSMSTNDPFFTLPTSCTGPQSFSLSLNSWEHPETFADTGVNTHNANDEETGFTGCGDLGFGPKISTAFDTGAADTPAGLTVEVKPPVGGLESAEGDSTANISNTTVALPEGIVINPGQAAGLQECGPGEDGLTTQAEKANGEENSGPTLCPLKSKVGTVAITTPLLAHNLEGNVYVLQSNPPELKLLLAASGEGVNLKLVGVVHLDEATGRLVTTFEKTPELPFTNLKLSFSGGAQAALDTPTQCGIYKSTSDFSSWASPFVSDFSPTAELAIETGPGGTPCSSNPLPFNPSLVAGATTDQAGGFTNFSLLLQRGDGQQRIASLKFKAPAGLTGELSNVPLCTNAQAEANACPEASKIGHTVVESGPGPYPLVVPEAGQSPAPIYLTESYDGAPFGLSIVVPLHVGPFVLPTQRVRAKIEVDPHTSQLTVTTNELPQVVVGVPTDLREVDAVIERPDFMINPTNCNPQEFSGTATGTPPPGSPGTHATVPIASHFQVGSCQALKFQPKFSVSTSGKTSRANGASLTAKLTYPNVPQGTESDIGLVKVELPKQLPSRLTTLQKACTNAQFEANPAGCPTASKIGYAVVHTALLPVPLEGPAIFVSHGGEAFPSLTLVLQGDNVTVDIVGTTFISKAGVTSTTFKTVPDDPFSSFELTLPEGADSALAANGNLCREKLVMPTHFTAQDGAELQQSTPISVQGCPTGLAVLSHKVKKQTVTLSIYAPAAGKLKLTGKGLNTKTVTAGAGTVTTKLTQTKPGKLKTKISIVFTPTAGKDRNKQTKTFSLNFSK